MEKPGEERSEEEEGDANKDAATSAQKVKCQEEFGMIKRRLPHTDIH